MEKVDTAPLTALPIDSPGAITFYSLLSVAVTRSKALVLERLLLWRHCFFMRSLMKPSRMIPILSRSPIYRMALSLFLILFASYPCPTFPYIGAQVTHL